MSVLHPAPRPSANRGYLQGLDAVRKAASDEPARAGRDLGVARAVAVEGDPPAVGREGGISSARSLDVLGCRRHGVVRRLTWVRWPPSSRSQGFRLALWTGVGTVSGALKDELCAVGLPVGVQLRIGMVSFATGASSPVSAFEPSFTSSGQSYHDLTAARAGPSRPARLRLVWPVPEFPRHLGNR